MYALSSERVDEKHIMGLQCLSKLKKSKNLMVLIFGSVWRYWNFEDLHNNCIMVYEIDYDSIILSKESTYDYIPNNLVYLLIKDYSDNADDLGRSKNSWPC